MKLQICAGLLVVLLLIFTPVVHGASPAGHGDVQFPRPIESYGDDATHGVLGKLAGRAKAEPFNLLATTIFVCAIMHTFVAARFTKRAHEYEHLADDLPDLEKGNTHKHDRLLFRAQLFHFLGEVEAVFGIWLIPLAIAIVVFHGWDTFVNYASGTSFAEPVFVVVVMAIASSKPVLRFAEGALAQVARLGGGSVSAWWLSILTVGPILGSFITEPAAMTICALLLSQRFYELKPSMTLRYATLGLLFVNISVGGTLTHFAAPPVVIVAGKWGWGIAHMFEHFGWKAVVGIFVANAVYFFVFRKELLAMKAPPASGVMRQRRTPVGVTATHLLFIVWVVMTAHYPPLVVMGFLFFLAFVDATRSHQGPIRLRGPMLVGFFLAALVVHGRCQQWWIAPVLGSLPEWPLMIGATLLTAVNDNAAITYLASLVPGFTDQLKFAVMAGAVTGGGLTVIANAPNPAGQSILQHRFGENGVSPLKLFVAALIPTVIMGAAFMLLR
ncbi:MAG TPA: putative Na+/H+ antiporter [Chthoniobacterales bacterium]